ncbi:hypothetical protein J6590_055168 [Homalodisca vitripennis]|nr:hypothetical protein J6590_055168 [Homalodisca vitripennis]
MRSLQQPFLWNASNYTFVVVNHDDEDQPLEKEGPETQDTASSSCRQQKFLPTPQTCRGIKRKIDDDGKKEEAAFGFLEVTAKSLSEDDCSIFGEMIATQLRKLTPHSSYGTHYEPTISSQLQISTEKSQHPSNVLGETPGIIDEINGLDTLNRYIKDANESPVAKYLRHIASLISGGTASLKNAWKSMRLTQDETKIEKKVESKIAQDVVGKDKIGSNDLDVRRVQRTQKANERAAMLLPQD